MTDTEKYANETDYIVNLAALKHRGGDNRAQEAAQKVNADNSVGLPAVAAGDWSKEDNFLWALTFSLNTDFR